MPATRRTVDAPTRVMHWLLALSFLGAYVTADGEAWRLLHVTLGYTMAGLLAFRIVWGIAGPRHTRLSALLRKLQGLPGWIKGLKAGTPNWRLAQSLLLTLSVVVLLALIAPLTLSGYGTYNEWAGDWLEDVHEFFGNALSGRGAGACRRDCRREPAAAQEPGHADADRTGRRGRP